MCLEYLAPTIPYLSYTLSGQPLSGCPGSRYYTYLHTCNTLYYPKVERSREALAQTKKRVASLEHAVFIQPALATARATA